MNIHPAKKNRALAAFTLIEIAICLAIIGFALVVIIGVLPTGMDTQRDLREQTIINQDATVLLEAIRSGARGADDLTNYVYAIANLGNNSIYLNPSLASQMNFSAAISFPGVTQSPLQLTNGANIIGLLSTPEFVDTNGNPTSQFYNYSASNHIIACVRSISGSAAEKPPQDNGLMVGDAFGYRVYCVNAVNPSPPLANYLHELRLTFLWPQLPNGNVGNYHQTFRVSVAGQLSYQPTNGLNLYFYQPQSFIQ
jgi:type II secretory pathway pseudopilin PulG